MRRQVLNLWRNKFISGLAKNFHPFIQFFVVNSNLWCGAIRLDKRRIAHTLNQLGQIL